MQLHFECRTTVLLLFDVVPIEVEYRIRSSETVIHILFIISYISLSLLMWMKKRHFRFVEIPLLDSVSNWFLHLDNKICSNDYKIMFENFYLENNKTEYSSMQNDYKIVSFISISFCINSWSVLIGNNNKILTDILVSPSYSLLLVYNLHNVCTTMYW